MSSQKNKIGHILKEWRKKQGLKQTEVAEILGVSNTYICHIENDFFDFRVGLSTLQRLVEAYKMPSEIQQYIINEFWKRKVKEKEKRARQKALNKLIVSTIKSEIKREAKSFKIKYSEISRRLKIPLFVFYRILSKPDYGEKKLAKILKIKNIVEQIAQEKRDKIQEFRELVTILRRKGYTIERIAYVGGCSVSSIKRYLNGQFTPSDKIIERLKAEILKKSYKENQEIPLREIRRTLGLTLKQVIKMLEPPTFGVDTLRRYEKNPQKYKNTLNFKKLVAFYKKLSKYNKAAQELLFQINDKLENVSRN